MSDSKDRDSLSRLEARIQKFQASHDRADAAIRKFDEELRAARAVLNGSDEREDDGGDDRIVVDVGKALAR
jgi:hypothetical protein